jgi:hypothetical protein
MELSATFQRGSCHYALTWNDSESNFNTAIGALCPAIHPQMVCPRLRAGARRQRRLVRHGVDRAVAPCGPRAQHQLGRGHPLRRTQCRVLRAPHQCLSKEAFNLRTSGDRALDTYEFDAPVACSHEHWRRFGYAVRYSFKPVCSSSLWCLASPHAAEDRRCHGQRRRRG